MRYLLSCTILLLLLGTTVGMAQVIYNNASTVSESYQRGLSGVIDAQGQKNLSDSQAAINLTDARSNQIDNQVKSVNAYWEKKSVYQQHQQQEFYEIQQDRAKKLQRNALQPLTSQEFDRTTGKITWLKVLTQSQYDEYRNTLDELFRKRAVNGYLSSDDYLLAQSTNKAFRAALTAQRDDYPGPILSQITRFVLKLNREMNDNLG